MSDSKYSPTSGDMPAPSTEETANRSTTATNPIDLFADQPSSSPDNVAPPPNDVYIGEVVSTGASSNMQPSVRTRHGDTSVVVTESGRRNNTQFEARGGSGSGNRGTPSSVPVSNSLADTPLPANVQQEWDDVTEVTVLSSRLRILYFCELLIIIVNAIVLPWAAIAIPFCLLGYIAVRWFKYFLSIVGMLTFLIMVIISIVTAATTDTDGGFEEFAFIVICIIAIVWHIWVGYTNYRFMTVMKKLSAENLEQVQREMPLVCGCL